ncbi:hypothetical protein [uncultured Enterococcus sp.]|uniref:hypothetical protein n=1 Tax=uncultured Enterococcus sp. TaxID=167972 RepID=UPI0025958728|nr:hypothetical protein [uncultured Enterococcus sp.]
MKKMFVFLGIMGLFLTGCSNLKSVDIDKVEIDMTNDKVVELIGKPDDKIEEKEELLDEATTAIKADQYISDRAGDNSEGVNEDVLNELQTNLEGLKKFKVYTENGENTYINEYTYKDNKESKTAMIYFYQDKVIAIN